MIPGEKVSLAGLTKEQMDGEIDTALDGAGGDEINELIEKSLAEFRTGAMVAGKVLGIQGEEVVLDVGYKSEGYVPVREFEKPGEISPGDSIQVYVEGVDAESGTVNLSKRKADRIRNWEKVVENHVVGDMVTGRVMRKIKGGLLVDIGVPAFLPASQVDIKRVGDVGEFIGQTLTAKIIKIDEERRNIVVSRRKLLDDERDVQKKKLLAEIQRGEIRRGVVKNLTDFGAFVDLGGIDGLLHITDMSWGRVGHPSEILKPEQIIDVKILDFDLDRERISLGYKQLQANPWTRVQQKYPIGSKVTGKVVTLQPYGAFVKIEDGVEGLVHVSEMSWGRPVSHPSEVVKVGDDVEVVVLSIDEDRQEISLGLKQATGDPWADVAEKFPTGSMVKGVVRNLTSYGAFVELAEGVDGLLHVSDMSWTKKISHPSAVVKKGDEVEAVVLSVDPDRKRVALGIKQLAEDPWKGEIPEKFRPGAKVTGKVTKLASFGAFVEVEQGLEGLLHVSEISEEKVEKPEDVLSVGQEVELRVINLDAGERKIGLSIKALDLPDEAFEEAASESVYAARSEGEGTTLGEVAGEALGELAAKAEAREATDSAAEDTESTEETDAYSVSPSETSVAEGQASLEARPALTGVAEAVPDAAAVEEEAEKPSDETPPEESAESE